MYTIDDEQKDLYEDEDYESSNWDNRKGLIFKIIIIVLCIIVLIWLIKALKSNSNLVDNGEIHMANTEKIRLAAEDYFFLKNNKNNTSYVTLSGLKNAGLISDVVDANNKVCSDTGTNVNLDNDIDAYKMTIKFSCSTTNNDEVFYYHKNTLACLNCSGKTHMDGKKVVVVDDDKENEYPEDDKYSCSTWSDWTTERVNNSYLTERTKVLVQGVKYGTKTVYGDWSGYTTTPIVKTDEIEIDTRVETINTWSEVKTGTNVDTNNAKIKVISKETVSDNSNTCDGFIENNICYSNKVTVGNLSYSEYLSGKYKVKKAYCEDVKTLKNSEGRYEVTYIDCEYNTKISEVDKKESSSYTVYTYQELETKDITYYRYRTINTVNEPVQYTKTKYEENNLPTGYVKVAGSEEVYYSYKYAYCEK